MRNARVLAENPDRKKQLRRYPNVWTRKIILKNFSFVRMDWILPTLGGILWRAFVNVVIYYQGAQEAGHFLINFSNFSGVPL